MTTREPYDVAILGSGLAGTMLGAVLARHGHKVLILEKDSHPKFTIGESMLPQSATLLRIIGERYDVPEIAHLSRIDKVTEHVSTSCGVKKCFGFLYHREGQAQDPQESHMLIQPHVAIADEVHYYRQDVDMHVLNAAIKHGAEYRDHTTVTDLTRDDTGWEIDIDGGDPVRARFVVDGTGYRSVLAHKFGLRETPTRLKSRTRSIFTHMEGVPRYDEFFADPDMMKRFHQGWGDGTLHHMFDGGWFWIIPFGNHGDSGNPRCSVGLTLDRDKHPQGDMSPEEEFRSFVERFPGIDVQLGQARAVEKWVRAPQLQYSSTRSVGDRFFLLPHSYGFVDPLFSRGMISTADTINSMAWRLMEALDADDFSLERFEYIEKLQRDQLDHNDNAVRYAYKSFSDFELWNAWVKVWLSGKMYGDLRLFAAYSRFLEKNDIGEFLKLEQDPQPGAICPHLPEHQQLAHSCAGILEQWEAGEVTAEQGGARILSLLDDSGFLPPAVDWGDSYDRHVEVTPPVLMKMLYWGGTQAPDFIRDRVFQFDPKPLIPKPEGAPRAIFQSALGVVFGGLNLGIKMKNFVSPRRAEEEVVDDAG